MASRAATHRGHVPPRRHLDLDPPIALRRRHRPPSAAAYRASGRPGCRARLRTGSRVGGRDAEALAEERGETDAAGGRPRDPTSRCRARPGRSDCPGRRPRAAGRRLDPSIELARRRARGISTASSRCRAPGQRLLGVERQLERRTTRRSRGAPRRRAGPRRASADCVIVPPEMMNGSSSGRPGRRARSARCRIERLRRRRGAARSRKRSSPPSRCSSPGAPPGRAWPATSPSLGMEDERVERALGAGAGRSPDTRRGGAERRCGAARSRSPAGRTRGAAGRSRRCPCRASGGRRSPLPGRRRAPAGCGRSDRSPP